MKIYFNDYKDLSYFPYVGRVAAINEPSYGNLSLLGASDLHDMELSLKYKFAVTGDGIYYQKIMEVQKEIAEKYPYDGKSSFLELLNKYKN